MKISLIIPAYNEEGNIVELYRRLNNTLKTIDYEYEVLFINDGSTDQTEKIILDLAQKDKRIKLISFTRNFGHQYALLAGYNHCSGDAAITLDCDLQHPPELIPRLISRWVEGFDVVNTKRTDTNQKDILKRLCSKYFYRLFSFFTNIPLSPGSADFRLVDRKVIVEINNLKEHEPFLRGMLHWFGHKTTTIEYIPDKRFWGESKYSLNKMVLFALNGITSFSIVPLRIVSLMGFAVSFLAFVYMLFSLYAALFSKNIVSGWTSVILSLLFMGGIQLISIGLLGEYIGRIFMELKERPRYVVKLKKGV